MGYFSNGTEGAFFEEEWCDTCQHGQDLHSDSPSGGCPVWDAHLFFAYEECGKKSNAEQILTLLIPRNADGLGNQCRMHLPLVGAVSKRQGKLFP